MGASLQGCVSRAADKAECCGQRHPNGETPHDDEQQEEMRVAAERERLLTFVDEENPSRRSKLTRFYSMEEVAELEAFRKIYIGAAPGRSNTLIDKGWGPWGISTQRGGTDNAWDEIDGTIYKIRGPTYLSDRKKENSGGALAELQVVDLFMSDTDIAHAAVCTSAKTVQRLRRDGEKRKLLVLNFRLVPLHVVIVWALPPASQNSGPAGALLARFASSEMSDEERNKRLKVIPRILTGPWPIRRLIGENSPAILGRGIPVQYLSSENELEISVSIASSSAAQRVSKALLRAGSALNMELALVVEGQAANELPEQVLGGFRISHAELGAVRTLSENTASPEAQHKNSVTTGAEDQEEAKSPPRPTFLPPA